ncbi:MAG: DnaJ domain-containing protein [Actinomycetales bacterium]|nr:DnaJ domain-containing protein [Actinomycetales bacterium]
MPESPLAASPYEVLGVSAHASEAELRRAYRARLRATHPDTGGAAAPFDAVQRAWELVGTPEARAAYDRGGTSARGVDAADARAAWAPRPTDERLGTRARATVVGEAGARARAAYLDALADWAAEAPPGEGRTGDGPADAAARDPYDPAVLRALPAAVRRPLATAVAQEETARALATLGIGFTVWHDVVLGSAEHPLAIDHLVLGPTGLWAVRSDDWGGEVKVARGEVFGRLLDPDERPVHELAVAAKRLARESRARVSALVVAVPDGCAPDGVTALGSVGGASALLVEQPRLADLIRRGLPGVGVGGTDLLELKRRVQGAVGVG